jgi:Na+-translocating ferredoxin:NAD+ oxidoreductase RNF subunit RnfB
MVIEKRGLIGLRMIDMVVTITITTTTIGTTEEKGGMMHETVQRGDTAVKEEAGNMAMVMDTDIMMTIIHDIGAGLDHTLGQETRNGHGQNRPRGLQRKKGKYKRMRTMDIGLDLDKDLDRKNK